MMKKILLFGLLMLSAIGQAQMQTVTYSVNPPSFEETTSITITVNGSSVNEATWGVTGNALYMWAWSLDANYANSMDCPTNGTWTASDEANRFTYNAVTDTYTKTFVPSVFFNRTGIGRIGFLVKAKNGTGDKKSQDIFLNVGAFQVTLTAPAENSATAIGYLGNLNIAATNTGGNASYTLKGNGATINSNAATSSYAFNHTNIGANVNYELEITQGSTTVVKRFSVIVNPGIISEAMPANVKDGVNYSVDATQVTLVLNAPGKDFIYVAGSFNNWNPGVTHAMRKDAATGKFWVTIQNLTPGQYYTYQYWVVDTTPLPNSPVVVKTADPFSTLVLSPFDDPEIANLGVYPNLPAYPAGQQREVSVIQTGPTAFHNYNWSPATTNFVKPSKKDLVIYEVLVRDFDANRTYQNMIDRFDYFKNLNVNAIQLMPVMEFEGNESWGYNTVFHMALDKRYGPPAKLKEFIDLCHQNGIAVILDVALNHVYGRSPLERMWMLDSDGDGWANGSGSRVSADNPYCNANAMHSYNVGTDLNHFREPQNLTHEYVKRTIEHWMNEYKIDGFRWDLTKGFTQNCPYTGNGGAQDNCTNGYQSDRVVKLKHYADLQWAIDPNFYVIFEHLGVGGSYNEEVEWANYRKTGEPDGISKGIMQWRKMTDPYANFLKGNATNLSGVADATERFIGYAESHDEERVMYKALTESGQTNGNLPKALKRMAAMGAVHLLVPGPKMVYHFGDLGYNSSIFTCSNGSVSNPNCKLDTKPQPQWTENWLGNAERRKIYDDWSAMIELRTNENVFENGTHTWNFTTGKVRLDVSTSNAPQANLSYVIALTNMTNAATSDAVTFPYTGTWYNLMDGSSFQVNSTSTPVSIEADGYRIFGNKLPALSTSAFDALRNVALVPNPASSYFTLNANAAQVTVFAVTGQLVKAFGLQAAEQQYDISDLKPGVYLVKLADEHGREKTMRLIKQ